MIGGRVTTTLKPKVDKKCTSPVSRPQCFGVNIEWTAEITWLFLIIGYFVGLILHEMKNIVEEALRDKDKENKQNEGKLKEDSFKKLLRKTFRRSVANEDYFFEDNSDKEMLKRVKKHILGEKEEDKSYITSVCVNELQIKGAITSPDRLKTQSEMALSICIALLLIAVGTTISGIICYFIEGIRVVLTITTVFISLIFSMLFYVRSIRMHKHYIRCLIRTYAVLNNLERNREGE